MLWSERENLPEQNRWLQFKGEDIFSDKFGKILLQEGMRIRSWPAPPSTYTAQFALVGWDWGGGAQWGIHRTQTSSASWECWLLTVWLNFFPVPRRQPHQRRLNVLVQTLNLDNPKGHLWAPLGIWLRPCSLPCSSLLLLLQSCLLPSSCWHQAHSST